MAALGLDPHALAHAEAARPVLDLEVFRAAQTIAVARPASRA